MFQHKQEKLIMDIGKRLQGLRVAKGLSQGDIETRTGLVRCYISRVENGYTVPNLPTLAKWAKGLELELYQIFFSGEGEPYAPQVAPPPPVPNQGVKQAALSRLFRRMSGSNQRLLLAMAREMVKYERDK